MKLRSFVAVVGLFLSGLVIAAIILLPVLWGLLISLKTRADALSIPPHWIFTPTLSNYKAALIDGPYAQTILNSLVIAGTSSALAMTLGVPAAYAFSRSRFKWNTAVFLGIMTIRMAPATVIALPLFLIFVNLGLIDTYIAIILVHCGVNLALVVWIMKGFLMKYL